MDQFTHKYKSGSPNVKVVITETYRDIYLKNKDGKVLWELMKTGNLILGRDAFPLKCPARHIHFVSEIQVTKPYRRRDLLYQKYVEEGKSIRQIAKEMGSARSTIAKYLRKFEILVRPEDKQRSPTRFGQKMKKLRILAHKRELEVIEKMKSLRNQGFSYAKIAEVLNTMKIPTKTRKGKWYAKTVRKIFCYENLTFSQLI